MPKKVIKKIIFIGSKELGLKVFKSIYRLSDNLDWIVVMPDDSSDNRSINSEFIEFTKVNSIKCKTAKNKKALEKIIINEKPDIGFVCGLYWIINKSILDSVNHGLWVMHNSLLPKYRGGAPLVWSIINDEKFVGTSIFRMEAGMDTGEILLQIKINISDKMYIGEILDKIQERTINELPKKWAQLLKGSATTKKQNEKNATYCAQRIEEDGIIDWKKDSKYLYNFIRAQSKPYPCAYIIYKNQKIKILKSKIFKQKYYGTPGQVISVKRNSVLIACGNNSALELLDCEINEKFYSASQVFKSINIRL